MKNKPKKKIKLIVLLHSGLMLAYFALISGCNFIPPVISQAAPASDFQNFSRREELAILKAKPSHVVDVDTLSVMVNDILNTQNNSRNASGASPLIVSGVKRHPALTEKRFISNSIGARMLTNQPEDEKIELYNFVIENPDEEEAGFVLTSNDVRIGYILAIVENGDLDDADHPFQTIFYTGLTEYIEETITLYNDISQEEIVFGSTYEKNGDTNTSSTNMASGFRNTLSYAADTLDFREATVYSESGSSFSITYKNNSKDWVIGQLSKSTARPVIFLGQRIDNVGTKHGHYWLVDGYGTLSYYTEYLENKVTGQTYTYRLNLNNCIMVHCNLGWGGSKDGWYIFGLFDTKHVSVLDGLERNILSTGIKDYSYDVFMFAPYH